MVSAAAAGAGGAALRTTMVIGARLGAIRQFGLMQNSMGLLNNRMTQTGLGVANLVGSMSLLGGAANLLGNPITGLLGALGAAAAGIDWLGQEEAAQKAAAQLRGWKEEWSDEEIQRLIDNMQHLVGRDRAAEIMQHTDAMSAFAKLFSEDEGMAKDVMVWAEKLSDIQDLDFAHTLDLMSRAAGGNKDAVMELGRILGDVNERGVVDKSYAWSDALGNINRQMDGYDSSAIRESANVWDEIGDKIGFYVAEVENFLAYIPWAIGEAVLFVLNMVTDIVTGVVTSITGTIETARVIIEGILTPILMIIKGDWDEIIPWFTDEWWPRFLGAVSKTFSGIVGILDGLGLDWMTSWLVLGDFWELEWNDRGRAVVDGLLAIFEWAGQYFKQAGEWLGDQIWTPFFDFFKNNWNALVGNLPWLGDRISFATGGGASSMGSVDWTKFERDPNREPTQLALYLDGEKFAVAIEKSLAQTGSEQTLGIGSSINLGGSET